MLPLHSNNSTNNNNNNELPTTNPNPILIAYEDFINNTPYITRTILNIQIISYIISYFINTENIFVLLPKYIYNYEILQFIYRIILSNIFVNTNIFLIILSFINFLQISIRYERCIGSIEYLYLCCIISLLTNILFSVVCIILYYNTNNELILLYKSYSIWNIIFGIISLECIQSPNDNKLKFFIWNIPVLYYPLILLLFFYIFSNDKNDSNILSYIISTFIGYCIGYNKLEFLKLSKNQLRKLEETNKLINIIKNKEGWILLSSALGSNAWNENNNETSTTGSRQGLLSKLFQRQQPLTTQTDVQSIGHDQTTTTTTTSATNFPSTGGRMLGGGNSSNSSSNSQRRPVDTRAARLQALDKKTQNNNVNNSIP